jgi:GNAT superfamily N-acetyltransferase
LTIEKSVTYNLTAMDTYHYFDAPSTNIDTAATTPQSFPDAVPTLVPPGTEYPGYDPRDETAETELVMMGNGTDSYTSPAEAKQVPADSDQQRSSQGIVAVAAAGITVGSEATVRSETPSVQLETLELDPSKSDLATAADELYRAEFDRPLGWNDHNRKVYATAANGKLHGFASVEVDPDTRSAYIDHVAVVGRYRGLGIGSNIINTVVEIVGQEGYDIVEIQPQTPQNEELYERLGFRLGPDLKTMTRPTDYHPHRFLP